MSIKRAIHLSLIQSVIAGLLLSSQSTFIAPAQASTTIGVAPCVQTVNDATGITVTQVDSDCVISFKSTGINYSWTVPAGVTAVEALVVAGGGGGGFGNNGGGGGAGELLVTGGSATLSGTTIADTSAISITPGSTTTITVGAGGTSGAPNGNALSAGSGWTNGGNGLNSSFGEVVAIGGGGGGGFGNLTGAVGGSGGGGARNDSGFGQAGGAAGSLPTPRDWTTFKNAGSFGPRGGGGGAGSAGLVGGERAGVITDSGLGVTIWGNKYAGGGLGYAIYGQDSYLGGDGRTGADPYPYAGSGGNYTSPGRNNTGTGGGAGAPGGSGVVVVRYAITPNAPAITGITSGNQSLSVSFDAPSDNGATITDYEYSINNGSNWISAGTTSPFTISGLTNGTQYTVLLRALNGTSVSTASTGVSATPNTACSPSESIASGFTTLTFSSVGSCSWAVPEDVSTARVLVVGGGGGAGSGGGGGGGFLDFNPTGLSGSIQIIVGYGGGASSAANQRGVNGGTSAFGSSTAGGGGGGGRGYEVVAQGGDAPDGVTERGSGGGASSSTDQTTENSAGKFKGGARNSSSANIGGGGGGAAGDGFDNDHGSTPGKGGAGKSSDIEGTIKFYAGGGGSAHSVGGGGEGSANAGGGGTEGPGNNGVVIVKYANPQLARTISIDSDSYESTYVMTDSAPTITATASVGGGTKSFSSSTSSVCTVNSSTGVVTFSSAGTCTLTASIATDDTYEAATSSSISFTITRATQTVTWSPTTALLSNASPATPSALATALGSATITYSVTDQGTTGCSVNSSSGVLTFTGVGTCVVRASAAQTTTYAAGNTSVSFVISQATVGISVTQSSNGTISPGTSTINYGANQLFTFTPDTGYSVASITVDGVALSGTNLTNAISNGYEFTNVIADRTITATYSLNTYTITLNKGANGTGSDQTLTKTHGVSLTLPNSATANTYFTRTGHTVTGWSTTDGGAKTHDLAGSFTTDAATTLYPVWTTNTYTVTYNYNDATGGNSVVSSTYTYDGIRISLPTPTKTGFTFGGWYSNAGLSDSIGAGGASYEPTANITLFAKWDAATYTVLFEYNGATGGNPADPVTYTTGGTAITLPTPTRDGYTFSGWYSNAELTASVGAGGASYQPTLNLTIYAKWAAITRTVTYFNTNSSAGSVPTDSNSYIIGDTVVVKSNSGSLQRTGFTFEGWVTNSDGTGTALNSGETLTVATANISLYPQWSANTYTITYNKNGGTGDLSLAPTSWQTGTSNVTLPSSGLTKTGFNFDGWQELGSITKLNNSYQPNYENVTLVARWAIKSINYNFDKGTASGDITGWPANSSANFGTTITLPDLSGTTVTIGGNSYLFFAWEFNRTTYNSGDSFVLSETVPTFTAQWVRLFDVRYGFGGGTHAESGDKDSECVTGDLCADLQKITLRSAPGRAGYTFDGWKVQDTATVKAASAAHQITATGYLFYAQWTAINYQFTFNSLGGSLNPARVEKTIGQLVAMPSPGTKTGYTFAGWSADGGTTRYIGGSSFVVATEGQAFSAQWVPDVYTITYDWQGGIGSSAKVSDNYTVGTGDMALPTAVASGYSRDGYNFSGWARSIGGPVVSGYQPTLNEVLYAVWADGNFTLNYDSKGGTLASALATVARGNAVNLPTPLRNNFTFVGWFDSPTGGNKLGDAATSFTPLSSSTLYARWVQDSLFGIDLATLETGSTYTASNSSSTDTTITHAPSGTSARIQIPSGALPNGTVVTVRYFKETSRQSNLIPGDNSYFFALLVSWLSGSGDSATVPNTAAGKPISVTLNNPNIKSGAMVYQVIGERVTELGRATADGTVTVQLTEDPEIVVAATKPMSPTAVVATAGDSQVSISWAAANSGGSPITGYTVTANPGGATCTVATTSCTIGSLTNNTAYTFTVRATNAVGISNSSAASSAVTPVGATYIVTFNSNGGSSVANGSFFSGGNVSAPTRPTRSGFTFEGWSTELNDATTLVTFPYTPGVTSAITLYALWAVAPTPPPSSASPTPTTPPVIRPSASPSPSLSRVINPPAQTVVTPNRPTTPVVITPNRDFEIDQNSQAIVDGKPAAMDKTRTQNGGVAVTVGQVQVGISPNGSTQSSSNVSTRRTDDVSVSSGQSAKVSGEGLLPGSSLQVLLPAMAGNSSKELARIPVKSDGTFDSDLTFVMKNSDTPLPIGRQILEVAGFDAQGNQTVVAMTLNITQGDPSPELNRNLQALPTLSAGQSLATSAGIPQAVTIEVSAEDRKVAVVSEDWTFIVNLPEGSGGLEQVDNSANISFVQGKSATVSGNGFQANTRVDIWLFSDPTLLGSVNVSADGTFSGEIYLDASYATTGEHTLQLQGVGIDGFIKAANLGVLVQEASETPSENNSDPILWFIGALVAATLISVSVLAIRRNRGKK